VLVLRRRKRQLGDTVQNAVKNETPVPTSAGNR
jgi:hypothetical protein